MIKAVLFDLDGTLVNSLEDLAASTNYALSLKGYPTHPTESFKRFVGDGMVKLIERALPDDKASQEEIKAVLDIFLAHYKEHYADRTAAYHGIPQLIEMLRDDGYRLAVISNKADNMTKVVTEKIFGNAFSKVFGKREGYPAKPDATLTNLLIESLSVDKSECVVVGDSGMDMAVARNAECIGIGVLWGFRSREELMENGADYIAESPEELYRIIKELK